MLELEHSNKNMIYKKAFFLVPLPNFMTVYILPSSELNFGVLWHASSKVNLKISFSFLKFNFPPNRWKLKEAQYDINYNQSWFKGQIEYWSKIIENVKSQNIQLSSLSGEEIMIAIHC